MSSVLYAQQRKECVPIGLSCEHLQNPLGVDRPSPRLSWQLADKRQGAKQSAYQIMVDTDSMALVKNKPGIWNSGKQLNSDMLIHYKGRALKPQTKYFWKVLVWDKNGRPGTSSIASFETGMMGGSTGKENGSAITTVSMNSLHLISEEHLKLPNRSNRLVLTLLWRDFMSFP